MSWLFSKAMIEACANSRSSLEQAEASLAENSLDGAPCALSNTMSMQEMSCLPDKTTDASTHSQSGMMLQHSMESRGLDLWMLSLAGSPARTFLLPEKGKDLRESEADYGHTWQESWMKFDRHSCSWKTHRCLWEEDLEASLLTFPEWGMMQDGVVLERAMPDFLTAENDSGWWPTPTKFDSLLPSMMPRNGDTTRIDKHGKQRKVLADGRTASMGLSRLIISMTGRFPKPELFEELMGWPNGWTELRVAATDKFQQWLRSHGNC
jgi:hypothetical protein